MMGRGTLHREIWSIHFHCPNTSRYYVIYSMQRDAEEFEDLSKIFRALASSMQCHPSLDSTVF
jgi:hypothetical protein